MRITICILISVLSIFTKCSNAQNINISGVINTYVQVTGFGSGNCIDTVITTNSAGFSIDDTVMIIQMKGATIDLTNTSAFGTILNTGDAGNYEISEIKNVIGNSIVLKQPLLRTYSISGLVQLIKVPSYSDATVTAPLTPLAWNGTIGGVLAFNVANTLTLNSDIVATGSGFKGGLASLDYYTGWFTDYFCTVAPGRAGRKGESISQLTAAFQCGRGCAANGGGSGTDINTGAAGGGNAGEGGHGGNNYYAPQILWGEKGYSLPYQLTTNKLFLGGGGGGGHQNNSEGTNGSDGGGIIFITASTIVGNGFKITANGNNVVGVAGIDGAGGAGAGGVVFINSNTFTGNLIIEAKGGKGGNQNYPPQCHGNGGGGGGGAILFSGAAFPPNVSPTVAAGLKGVGQCNGTIDDAANGQDGLIVYNWIVPNQTFTINIGPDTTLCSGATVLIGTTSQIGFNYLWSNGVTTATQTVNPLVATSYTLTVTNGNCINAVDSVSISVLQTPQAAFNFNVNCNQVAFTNNSTGNNSQFWYFGNGDSSVANNPVYTYPATGNYTVTLVASNANGCIDSLQQIVNVTSSSPVSNFTYTIDSCTRSVSFNNTSLNAVTYAWNFGDTSYSSLASPMHQFAYDGTFYITLISINACDTDSVQVPVQLLTPLAPSAAFSMIVDNCTANVQFTNQSQNGTSYFWNFGDSLTSVNANPIHNYTTSGIYLITLIVSNSCFDDTIQQTVVIPAMPVATAAFGFVTIPCDNLVTFNNNSTNAISYLWIFGDGTTDTILNPQHLYNSAQIYNAMLIVYDSCTSDSITISVDLTGNAPPSANFIINSQPCDTTSIQFSNQTQNGTNYYWTFGDGQTDTMVNPLHYYAQPGWYNVTLMAVNACDTDIIVIPVLVDSIKLTKAQFSFSKKECTGEITFENNSTDANSYLWLFGDGDTSILANPVHIYQLNGTYTVVLIANPNSLCADTFTVQIEVTEADTQQLFIPNCFTPNGDIFNETFEIKGFSKCLDYEIDIFNRWGQLIYSADNLYENWDGKYLDSEVPVGVYYYVIKSGSEMIKTGSVTVLR